MSQWGQPIKGGLLTLIANLVAAPPPGSLGRMVTSIPLLEWIKHTPNILRCCTAIPRCPISRNFGAEAMSAAKMASMALPLARGTGLFQEGSADKVPRHVEGPVARQLYEVLAALGP